MLLNESIPKPGQVLEMVPTDSYYVVFCVKLALFHLHYLPLVLIQVQVAKMLFSDRGSRIYYVFVCLFLFFIRFTIDFGRSPPWYTCFTRGSMVYVSVCEITSRFLFSFSKLITQAIAGVFLRGEVEEADK